MAKLKIVLTDNDIESTWEVGEAAKVEPIVPPATPPPRITVFYCSPLAHNSAQVVMSFTVQGGEPPVIPSVDYGDGTRIDHYPTEPHTYTQGGNYTVALTVRDVLGRTDTQSKVVVIDILSPDQIVALDSAFADRQGDLNAAMIRYNWPKDRMYHAILSFMQAGMTAQAALNTLLGR